MFDAGVIGLQRLHPEFQRRRDLFGTALLESLPGLLARPPLGKLKGVQQLLDRSSRELRRLDQRAVFGGNAPDASMDMIATRGPEIDLAMLDDRVRSEER